MDYPEFDRQELAGSSDFGGLLRQYRLAAGFSQEELAERACMSTNGIGALERGDRRTPQRETLTLLGEALSLSAEQRRDFEAKGRAGPYRRLGNGDVSGDRRACAATDAPSLVRTAIASALGLRELHNLSLLELVLNYLSDRALLIVLNNCEHVNF